MDHHLRTDATGGVLVRQSSSRRAQLSRDRRISILTAAAEVFVEEGFAASSMSTIASRLGGSKGTLYSYFSSKEELFAEVVSHECDRKIVVMFGSEGASHGDVIVALREFGRRFVRLILSEETMRFTRMIIAESARRPDLGALFYAAGPRQSRQRLASYLDEQVVARNLRPMPTDRVAQQFCDLCLSKSYTKRLMNINRRP